MSRVTVTDRDLGFEKVIANLEILARKEIKVGIQDNAGTYPDGTSVVDVAVWNEYGTSNMPSRPFIRQCYALNSEKAYQMLGKALDLILSGGQPEAALTKVGAWYQNRMKHTLQTYPWQPNMASTIARKKGSRPLIDTGLLLKSISHQIKDK